VHYIKGYFSFGKDFWKSIQVGKVKEQRFEEGLLDDSLQFFQTLTRTFKKLGETCMS